VQVGGQWQARFQGDAGYDADAPKVICDFWGEPIHYYRKSYPAGAPDQEYRPLDYDGDGTPDPVPGLSDFFCLRPFEVDPGAAADGNVLDANGDTTSSFELESGAFALFSRGADRRYTATARYDEVDEFNKDNIVEVGR
jgi:hypothetical protein